MGGGLIPAANQDTDLDIYALRNMALGSASPGQLEIAAASINATMEEYRARLLHDDFGDELMVVLLAALFQKPITVVCTDAIRTWHPDGKEVSVAAPHAVWVAHRREKHYYAILRSMHVEEARRRSTPQTRSDLSTLH